jgi:uncharacterized cysteine cluster protein YcgN (CxxCxxCC family)
LNPGILFSTLFDDVWLKGITAVTSPTEPFWQKKTLEDMTPEEWESLCDGCARCCVYKIEIEETGDIVYSPDACPLLDLDTCRCTDYTHRREKEPDCAVLTPENIHEAAPWLPVTCAYRRLALGDGLPAWHPLVTGNPNSTRDTGMSVRNHAWHTG